MKSIRDGAIEQMPDGETRFSTFLQAIFPGQTRSIIICRKRNSIFSFTRLVLLTSYLAENL